MSPILSRRLGKAVGTHFVAPDERARIIAAAGQPKVNNWPDLPSDVRELVLQIEDRPIL